MLFAKIAGRMTQSRTAISKLETVSFQKCLPNMPNNFNKMPNNFLRWMELTVPPGNLLLLFLIAPNLCADQLHLPMNLGTKHAGATELGSNWPVTHSPGVRIRSVNNGPETGETWPSMTGVPKRWKSHPSPCVKINSKFSSSPVCNK